MSRRLRIALLLLCWACGDDEVDPPGSDAGGGASCRELFGGAPVYRDCGGDAAGCAFYTRGPITTCEQVCAELGADCASSYRAENSCARDSGDLGCMTPASEHICVCLRPQALR